jgi:hypothetical protein
VIRPTERTRPILAGSAALALVALLAFAPQVWAASRAAFGGGAARSGAVTTASSAALAKRLSASLQPSAKSGATRLVDVLVVQKAGTGRPATLKVAVRVNLKGDSGHEYWAGRVAANRLAKLASGAGVEFVADNGRHEPPVVPDASGPSPAAQLAAGKHAVALLKQATDSGVVGKFAAAANSDSAGSDAAATPGGQPTDWFEVGPTHKSAAAWANGFTGAGVKVAVDDDGVDFGHPDLQGTQAYITDPASPYAGWPMAFDPYSTYLYALDRITGSTNVADGNTWFSATDATVSDADAVFDGSPVTLPGTSKSGTYHIGFLWDETLSSAKWFGEFPLLLVADEHTAGVYDTVYVDLNDDRDFTNDKACTKDSPISYLDYLDHNGNPGTDGVADLSGGMVYWISDGANDPPYADQVFSDLGSASGGPPEAGALVCMMGAYDAGADHGTLCASDIVGQGRIDGPSVAGVHPSFKTGSGGMVQGGGRDAKLIGIGDIYNAYALSTLLAADFSSYGPDTVPSSGDEAQIVSNSYGESSTDNDEWDYASRYVTGLNTKYAAGTTYLFATGNGGPGYGTNAGPSPSTAVKVGASTQFGADGGWDSIDTTGQVTFGDVAPFSNRGPTAMGHLAPTIVADGAYAAGSEALSLAGRNGWRAWEIWGGTSRSTPVAAGNLSLVYQAFKSAHGRWPTYAEAQVLLSSGATDLNYDTLTQGAGMVNADRSTRLAAGLSGGGVKVSPSAWYPGSAGGSKALAFEQAVHPGETATGTLTITNPGTSTVDVTLGDTWLQRVRTTVVTLTVDPSGMSTYDFNRPDVLYDASKLVQAGDQLMTVRAVVPASEFDRNGDYQSEDRFRLLTYDWTDRNGDGRLWTDANGNGVVNEGEIEAGEYMRFTYANADADSLENRVQNPAGRAHDGVFIGLQHTARSGQPVHVTLEISFWRRADVPWLSSSAGGFTLAGGASAATQVGCSVPSTAPLGVYEGEYRIAADGTTTIVPVVMTVAGRSANVSFGGAAGLEQLMDGSRVFGAQDWSWRAESGDWRFVDTEVPASEATTGSLWLVHTSWVTTPTDIDTLLYGPGDIWDSPFGDARPTGVVGPYDLIQTGGSPNTNTGSGVWTFDTATGGAQDWVTGPLSSGLNKIMLHDVGYAGASVGETFTGEAGVLRVAPAGLSWTDTATAHTADLAVSSTLDLPGFDAVGFGLSRVLTYRDPIVQYGNYTREFDVAHAAYVEASTANGTSDIDLYLERWDGSGWVGVAASESSGGNEYVKVLAPADGHYRARVYGYAVSDMDRFSLRIVVPQGGGVTLSGIPAGPVPAGTTVHLTASFAADRSTLDERDGQLVGVVSCGPAGASRALQLPVSLDYPLTVDGASPAAGASDVASNATVAVRFSRRVDPSTLTSATFYLVAGGRTVRSGIAYDDASAAASLTVALTPGTVYTAVVTSGVHTRDGMALPDTRWSFTTRDESLPTAVALSIPSTSVRWGSSAAFAVTASRVTTAGRVSDPGAPVALRFRASGSSTWTTAAVGVTASDGVWRGHVTGTRPGSYLAVRVANWSGRGSSTTTRWLGVAFAPSISAGRTSTRHGHSLKVSVTVRPGSAASRRLAKLQRWELGRWVTYGSVRLSSSGTGAFWSSRSTRGTRRIRLVLSAGTGYGTGTSNTLNLRWW